MKAFLNCVPDVPRAFHRAGRFTVSPPSFISLKVPAAIVEFRPGSSSEFEIKESLPFVLRFKRTGHLPDFRLEFPDNLEVPRVPLNKKRGPLRRGTFSTRELSGTLGSFRSRRANFNTSTARSLLVRHGMF